jgi:hypothetical protein
VRASGILSRNLADTPCQRGRLDTVFSSGAHVLWVWTGIKQTGGLEVRKPALILAAVLVSALGFTAIAGAVGIIRPTKITASVKPPHRNRPPFRYTISGKLTYPRTFCPPGTTNPAYCTTLTNKTACAGLIKVKIHLNADPLLKRSNYNLKTLFIRIKSNCTYSATTTFKKSIFTAKARFKAHAPGSWAYLSYTPQFFGNAALAPFNIHDQHVLAKVQQP